MLAMLVIPGLQFKQDTHSHVGNTCVAIWSGEVTRYRNTTVSQKRPTFDSGTQFFQVLMRRSAVASRKQS